MKLEINPRENGACPLCKNNGRCPLQDRFRESMKDIDDKQEMEIVIYSCPRFKEKF
ncbi:MAG: hypothetical protein JXB03_09020 [Spirochaetales bacterium]|nr:hypothetical protein [Spirochaetales bacterium]